MGVHAVANQANAMEAHGADERIVAALLERGRLKEPDLARVRRLQEETGGSLLALLSRLGLLTERDHAETDASLPGPPLYAARDLPDEPTEETPLRRRIKQTFIYDIVVTAHTL